MVGENGTRLQSCWQYVALEHGTCLHSCRVRDISSHFFRLPPWVWVISFDHSSSLCHVTMASDPLMSNTAKSNVMSPICLREVGLFSFQPSSDFLLVLIHKHYIRLSHDDVGNIMDHLRSRSLPVDFSSLFEKLIQRLPSGTFELACLNGRFFTFDVRFSLLSSDRVILRVFDASSLIHVPQIVPVVP